MKWVNLPLSWDLGNVRAIATLIINLACVIGIWTLGISRWKRHAVKVSRHTTTGLFGLLEVSSTGEAIDTTVALVRTGRASSHLWLLFQCAVVALLSILGMLAGPIARYSIRLGFDVVKADLPGIMATTNNMNSQSALVKWNLTINRLSQAGFPDDQLLDYLPDVRADWQYEASEWNSSWKMSCEYTPQTVFPMKADWVISEEVLDQISDVRAAYPPDLRGESLPSSIRVSRGIGSFFENGYHKDLLLFITLSTSPSTSLSDRVRMEANNETMRFVFVAVHMHNISMGARTYDFGVGPADNASYTRADCTMKRGQVPDDYHISYLWTNDTASISRAVTDFHKATMTEQSIGNQPIYVPSGRDLSRFLQAYMIVKDVQFNHTVTRPISTKMPRIKIAVAALVLFLAYVMFLAVTLAWSFIMYPVRRGLFIPRTKVDWMMETVREVSARDFDESRMDASRKQLCADTSVWSYGDVFSRTGKEYVALRL